MRLLLSRIRQFVFFAAIDEGTTVPRSLPEPERD